MILNLTAEEYEFLVELLSDTERVFSESVSNAESMQEIAKFLLKVSSLGQNSESQKKYSELVEAITDLKTKTMNLTALLNNIAPERKLKETA